MSVNSVSNREQWIIATHLVLPNGAAHRLFNLLKTKYLLVGFCGVPFPGAQRTRKEFVFPSSAEKYIFQARKRVSYFSYLNNIFYIFKYARKLKQRNEFPYRVVCCDPLMFLEIKVIFRLANVKTASVTLWFVDWSAQRLDSIISGFAYRLLIKLSGKFSTVIAGISESATAAIKKAINDDSIVFSTVPNIPLQFNESLIPKWENRKSTVVSMSGLLNEQGTSFMDLLSDLLNQVGIELIIIGDGPLASEIRALADSRPNVIYLGLIENIEELASHLGKAKVGLALYDPSFPMYSFSDSLKIKDYLSAGLKVVSTLPTSTQDKSIYVCNYDVQSIYESIVCALESEENPNYLNHPLLVEPIKAVEGFIRQVESIT